MYESEKPTYIKNISSKDNDLFSSLRRKTGIVGVVAPSESESEKRKNPVEKDSYELHVFKDEPIFKWKITLLSVTCSNFCRTISSQGHDNQIPTVTDGTQP